MAIARINAAKLMNQVTLQVKVDGTRELSARLWLAKKLIRLAAYILGCGIEITQ